MALFKRARFSALLGLVSVAAMATTQTGTWLHAWLLAMCALIGLRGLLAQMRIKSLERAPAGAMRHAVQDAVHVALISAGWGVSLILFDTGAMDWSYHTRLTFLVVTLVVIIFSNGSVYLTAFAYAAPLFLSLVWLFSTKSYIVPKMPHMVTLFGFGMLLIAIVRQMRALALERFALIQTTQALNASLANEQRLHQAMAALSNQDELTGLLNRRGILAALAAEIERAHRHQTGLSMLTIDIDHFKRVNDTQGHAGGDAVLQRVTRTVESLLRKSDHFGRLGGDELLMLIPQPTANGTAVLAERVRQSVADLGLGADEQSDPVTLSIGVANLLPEDDSKTFLARADQALYLAKAQGRNQVVVA